MKNNNVAISRIILASVILTSCISCGHRSSLVPRPDHVIIVIEENHEYNQLIGSINAPFINQLADQGALFTDSHGVTHPSQPNYLAIYSGSTQGVGDDKCLENETPYNTPNLGSSLLRHGHTFKGFAQTMPSAGFLPCTFQHSDLTGGNVYARKHTPWINWQGTNSNNIPASLSQPMTAFPKDFNELPDVAFVVPDQDYDMHNIGKPGDTAAIQRGDQWLKDNLSAYAEWAKTHNSLLILTFDEDNYKHNDNHIATIFSAEMIKPGKYGEQINHYNVLHTVEAMFDLPVEDTTNAKVITSVWRK